MNLRDLEHHEKGIKIHVKTLRVFIWPIESPLEIVGHFEEFQDYIIELLVPYIHKRGKEKV